MPEKNRPLVSVVMPNYNYGRFLRQSIDSVLAQTYKPVELIVIDDESTDDSPEVLASYGTAIRAIRQKNAGVSVARNRGIAESRGEFIAFLDSDDLWMPEKLASQMPLFANPRTGLVYCGCYYCDAAMKIVETVEPTLKGVIGERFDYGPRAVFRSGPSTVVIRRDVFEHAGLFDPKLSILADWDMWRRIITRYEVDVVSKPLSYYRVHPASISRRVDNLEPEVATVLKNAFSDALTPEAALSRKGEILGRWHLMLSGDYFHAGNRRKCLEYMLRAVRDWPQGLLYVLQFPLRAISRRLVRS